MPWYPHGQIVSSHLWVTVIIRGAQIFQNLGAVTKFLVPEG